MNAKTWATVGCVTFALGAGVSSCSLFSDEPQDVVQEDSQNTQAAEEGDYDYQEDDSTASSSDADRPHPERATAPSTLTLIQIHPQPDAANLMNCQDSVQALVVDAANQQDMITVQKQVMNIASADPGLYHWCFYHLMVRLDQDLARSQLLLNDRAQIFFSGMKTLWVMARSLDQLSDEQNYFDYLRQRYVEISRHSFGRELEVVASPLDNDRLFYEAGGKPAAPAH